jgi:peptidoglycan/LPS O-acetylase OafA/YrhL
MKIGYLPHIDGLRAIAVISVLLFHVDVSFLSGGYVGVDIFFVISGYLITNILIKELENTGRISFKQFYLRRFRRLMPAYFAMACVTTVFAALLFSPGLFQSYGSSLVASLFSVSNVYFWLQADYFDTANHLKPLLHTWSLSVEEQFYLFWPLTLLALYKFAHKKWMLPLLLLMIVVSLQLNIMFQDGSVGILGHTLNTYIENGRSTIFYNLPFRVFEFAIGAILVLIPFKTKTHILHDIFCVLGLGLITYSFVYFTEETMFPSFNALIPAIGTGLVIYSGGQCRFHLLFTNKLMLFIGVISYSLYLVHWPIVVFYKYLLLGQELTVLDQVYILAASVVLGYLSYRYIETPFRKPIKRDDLQGNFLQKNTSLVGVTVFVGLFITGLHVYKSMGWPWRVNNGIKVNYSGNAKDFHKEFYGGAGYPGQEPIVSNNTIDIVLIGDSHGRHYAHGIDTVITQPVGKKLQISTGESCFYLPNYTRLDAKRDYDKNCPKGFAHMKAVLSSVDAPPLVILSQLWLRQLSFAYKLNQAGERIDQSLTEEDILTSLLELKTVVGDSELLVIGQVPSTNKLNTYDIVTRPNLDLWFGDEYDWFLFADRNPIYVAFNQKLKHLAETSQAFTFLDPFEVFCDETQCRNLTATSELIYSDTHHLSKIGSVMVIEHFKYEINALLNKKLDSKAYE